MENYFEIKIYLSKELFIYKFIIYICVDYKTFKTELELFVNLADSPPY
jgi:hypothetical protein